MFNGGRNKGYFVVSDKNERHVGLLMPPFLVQMTFYAICLKIYGSLETLPDKFDVMSRK